MASKTYRTGMLGFLVRNSRKKVLKDRCDAERERDSRQVCLIVSSLGLYNLGGRGEIY